MISIMNLDVEEAGMGLSSAAVEKCRRAVWFRANIKGWKGGGGISIMGPDLIGAQYQSYPFEICGRNKCYTMVLRAAPFHHIR